MGPTQKGRFLTLYSVMMSCRKAPPEFRFASSTLRNFVPSGAAHEAAAGHALSEPSDNYPAACVMFFRLPFVLRAKHRAGVSAPQWRRMVFLLLDEVEMAASSRQIGPTAP